MSCEGEVHLPLAMPSSQMDRVFSRREKGAAALPSPLPFGLQVSLMDVQPLASQTAADLAARLHAAEAEVARLTREKLSSVVSCVVTEFTPVFLPASCAGGAACGTQTDAVVPEECASCVALQEKLAACEVSLGEWALRAREFKAKEAECSRLRTILNFSQLKKDSERTLAAEAATLQMKQEMSSHELQARAVQAQVSELERLREVEREYQLVRERLWDTNDGILAQSAGKGAPNTRKKHRKKLQQMASDWEAGSASTRAAAATAVREAAPSAASPASKPPLTPREDPALCDSETTYGTICDRIQRWVKKKEEEEEKERPSVPAKRQQQRAGSATASRRLRPSTAGVRFHGMVSSLVQGQAPQPPQRQSLFGKSPLNTPSQRQRSLY